MTSGTFRTIDPSKVWVNRTERQRKELTGIEELAGSIAKIGLIHPPVLKADGELVAGERRWTAIKKLGWTAMPYQLLEELSEEEYHLIELEENTRRVDITWQEQCLAVHRYHELRASQEPEWDAVNTAQALGLSNAEVAEKRAVAKELIGGNVRIAEAPKYSVARGIVRRDQERKKDSVLKELEYDGDEGAGDVQEEVDRVPLLNADFAEWTKSYKGEPFNFIHCDFPYGVNADKHHQGAARAFGGYPDSKDTYVKLLDVLAGAMQNVVAPSAHLMFWFSMDYYQMTAQRLEDMGWSVNPFPLIWYKSDNTGILPDPNRGPRRIYETAFFASRGDRKIVQAVGNCFAAPVTKTVHMSEKNEAMLRHFFRMTVDEHSRVLDPTCGSGNSVKAALAQGASAALGLEINEEFYLTAKEHWDD